MPAHATDLPFANVAFPVGPAQLLTYRVPPTLDRTARPGSRVLVPLGGRLVTGYLVERVAHTTVSRLKELSEVLDADPLLDAELLALTRWVADYYMAAWGEVIRSALPPGIDAATRRLVRLTPVGRAALHQRRATPREMLLLKSLLDADAAVAVQRLTRHLPRREGSLLVKRLAHRGWVDLETTLVPARVRARQERALTLGRPEAEVQVAAAVLASKAPRQAAILQHLLRVEGTLPMREIHALGGSSTAILALVHKGLVTPILMSIRREPPGQAPITPATATSLTPPQQSALHTIQGAIEQRRSTPILLFGVTGSGKTEVYLRAIEHTLAREGQALLLVPEIGLTPQIATHFRSRFGNRVALLHSALSPGERFAEWARTRRGEADIVIGARSAVFAPLPRLRIIVVDEEHEPSYKQEESPRYHARDVAITRAERLGCPILLGSATPSLESFRHAEEGRYQLIELPGRVGRGPMPGVILVDRRATRPSAGKPPILSPPLAERIADRLAKQEQTLLLVNRRGYARAILCRDCGFTLRCPACSVSLTFHRGSGEALCHYCNYRRRPPDQCPECGGSGVYYSGFGTEQAEREIAERFPGVRVARMDRDTTGGRFGHARILARLERGETDILVGTQMVAKGHDYPRITLAGVLSADEGLNVVDFRAGERTFTLLTQMVGRSGRGALPGEAVIQTHNPGHYCIQAALSQDFRAFALKELALRRERDLPPFTKLIRVVISGPREGPVEACALELAERLSTCARGTVCSVEGPAPAPLARLRGRYRWHLLVKGRKAQELHVLVQKGLEGKRQAPGEGLRIDLDVDPADTL
ncbi:MAG: primosomal protein N' [Candidatus Methylomirabilales bacterium]